MRNEYLQYPNAPIPSLVGDDNGSGDHVFNEALLRECLRQHKEILHKVPLYIAIDKDALKAEFNFQGIRYRCYGNNLLNASLLMSGWDSGNLHPSDIQRWYKHL